MLEAILVGIIDAVLLRKTMQFCSGVDTLAQLSYNRRQFAPLSAGWRGGLPLGRFGMMYWNTPHAAGLSAFVQPCALA